MQDDMKLVLQIVVASAGAVLISNGLADLLPQLTGVGAIVAGLVVMVIGIKAGVLKRK